MVDGLDLPNLGVPGPELVSPVGQKPAALVFSFVQDRVQIFQPEDHVLKYNIAFFPFGAI